MGILNSLKNSFSTSESENIWNEVTDGFQSDDFLKASEEHPQLIYKHSNRCSTCLFTKAEIEQKGKEIEGLADLYFLNVITHREISNKIASTLEIKHESPQAILIDNREVIWHASHGQIKGKVVLDELKSA